MWAKLVKLVGIPLITEIGKVFAEWLKDLWEYHKERKKQEQEVKNAIKQLNKANTKDELKTAIRNLHI